MLTKAIIIKKQNTGEYDQWVTCYTEEFGKLKSIAKSILKPNSIQALHLDIFNLSEFELINGRGMSIITGAQVINSFMGIKNSLIKTAVAYFFAEVVDKMVFENDKDGELWDFLIEFMAELNGISPIGQIRPIGQIGPISPIELLRRGQKKLLDILGYLPEMDNCKVCNIKLDEGNFGAFNHTLGGVVCKRCFLSGQEGILINKKDFSLLKSDLNNRRTSWADKTNRSVLDGMFEYIAGSKFSSLELLNVVK